MTYLLKFTLRMCLVTLVICHCQGRPTYQLIYLVIIQKSTSHLGPDNLSPSVTLLCDVIRHAHASGGSRPQIQGVQCSKVQCPCGLLGCPSLLGLPIIGNKKKHALNRVIHFHRANVYYIILFIYYPQQQKWKFLLHVKLGVQRQNLGCNSTPLSNIEPPLAHAVYRTVFARLDFVPL